MPKDKGVKELEDLPGIGEATAEKLRTGGVDSIDKIAVMSPYELSELSGINPEAAKKAVQAAQEATTVTYETGDQILSRRKDIGKITTGSKDLDSNATRKDEVLPRDARTVEKIIAGFPDKKDDYIKVKTIL